MCTYSVGCLEGKSLEKAVVQVSGFLVQRKCAHKGGKHSKIRFQKSVAHVKPQVQIIDLFYKA